ncbi:MAG: MbcA/ParS/Xre antitoxin family protein, partial [Acidobacteriota bacterium]|nr:MbcA/ParS/Xre antitoxin family protein [Acidobacteriota bacterium]
MQFDGTVRLPDGTQIAVVLEIDSSSLETSLANTEAAEIIARAMEVLGSKQNAFAWLRTPVSGLNEQRPID